MSCFKQDLNYTNQNQKQNPPKWGIQINRWHWLLDVPTPFLQIVEHNLFNVNTPEDILTVLVLYEVRLQDSVAFKSLQKALEYGNLTGHLFIYDNSATSQQVVEDEKWTIAYQHDPANGGVSRAYNQAFLYAKSHDLKWLLLVDQDTEFQKDFFSKYQDAVASYTDCQVFVPRLLDEKGLISPFKPGWGSGKRVTNVANGKNILGEIHAVNSGLLVSVELFEAVGGYDERLRLDFSDFSFFKRLGQKTNFIGVVDARCQHELSSLKKTNLKAAVTRFDIYLQGAKVMWRDERQGFSYFARALLRAIKLSFQYRSVRFIGSLLSYQP